MKSAAPDPTVVLLGNDAPLWQERVPVLENGEVVGYSQQGVPARHLSSSVTRVEMRPDFADPDEVTLALSTDNDRILSMIGRSLPPDLRVFAVGVNEIENLWGAHSAASPAWVSCDDKDFEAALAKHFGCPVGEPTALLTNGGRDALHAQHLTTAAQPAAFNFLGLANSATATTPAATDTTLTGEITTASGGLIRAVATYAHTAGTNTSTLTKTFTANGSDALPVTVSQVGVFNASTAGTMGYKTALNANATLNIAGDNVAVTWTDTVG